MTLFYEDIIFYYYLLLFFDAIKYNGITISVDLQIYNNNHAILLLLLLLLFQIQSLDTIYACYLYLRRSIIVRRNVNFRKDYVKNNEFRHSSFKQYYYAISFSSYYDRTSYTYTVYSYDFKTRCAKCSNVFNLNFIIIVLYYYYYL